MTNPELEKIVASTEAAIRQAYALGRRDALDHVARWAQTEESTGTRIALGDAAATEPPPPQLAAPAQPASGPAQGGSQAAAYPPADRPRGFGALLRDFVYPSD